MNRLRRFARVYRSPIKSESGLNISLTKKMTGQYSHPLYFRNASIRAVQQKFNLVDCAQIQWTELKLEPG